MMTITVISALVLAFIIYIGVGISLAKKTKGIADMLPLGFNAAARVKNSTEFSSSTVATTISLATVIIAFFALAQDYGIWLFWSVITTSTGLFLVRLLAKRIWHRLSEYDHRPTIHEFLGNEFNSSTLSYFSAACTSLGFLSAFAVELTVGSKLFAALVPTVTPWIVVIILSIVAFVYTAIGGFRAVIITDRIQMSSIWLLLIALPVFYIYFITAHGGWAQNSSKLPANIFTFSARDALIPFLLGIFIINIPTYISDMSIWQRIAGAQKNQTVMRGLWRSVFSSAATWTAFVLLACFAFVIIDQEAEDNPLLSLLNVIGTAEGFIPKSILFIAVLGLYGAMLSTASTQLIAVSHTLYEDIFSRLRKHSLTERLSSKKELNFSRIILVSAAVVSTLIVQLLARAGFKIEDFVFAVYGAQVGLCPLVTAALILKKDRLKMLSAWAASGIALGFITAWTAAVYGRFTDNTNLVYLSPVLSIGISSVLIFLGMLTSVNKENSSS